jgi:hypothetical protein
MDKDRASDQLLRTLGAYGQNETRVGIEVALGNRLDAAIARAKARVRQSSEPLPAPIDVASLPTEL